jgi:hypothetical protein
MTEPDICVRIAKITVGGNIPAPASLLAKKVQVVRRPEDAAQGICLGRAQGAIATITRITFSGRTAPATVLASCRAPSCHEIAASLDSSPAAYESRYQQPNLHRWTDMPHTWQRRLVMKSLYAPPEQSGRESDVSTKP